MHQAMGVALAVLVIGVMEAIVESSVFFVRFILRVSDQCHTHSLTQVYPSQKDNWTD